MRCNSNKKNDKLLIGIATGVLAGAVIGAVVSLLTAPQSGKESRAFINKKAKKYAHDLKGGYESAKESVVEGMKKGKSSLKKVFNKADDQMN
ncbi:MAG: YtxH domain-containing protein [Taibaiella sp.]|nr:YtxH domain-containing protein [Taibaiella sp.]MBX9449186.1 YtxH domain-containing protein [Taibaiella sp.]